MKLLLGLFQFFIFIQIVFNHDPERLSGIQMDQVLMSPQGTHYARISSIGNLVIYLVGATNSKKELNENNQSSMDIPIWISRNTRKGSAPFVLHILPSGNLTLNDSQGNSLWSAGANNKGIGPYMAEITEDGYIVVIDSTGTRVWKNQES